MTFPLTSFSAYQLTTGTYVPFIFSVQLYNIDGDISLTNFNGPYWLQIHDSPVVPVAGTVPLKSIYIGTAGPLPSYYATIYPITLQQGLCFVLSSTPGVYTAVVTPPILDFYGEVALFPLPMVPDQLTATNNATNDKLQVWSQNDPGHALFSATFTPDPLAAFPSYWLMIFPKDNPAQNTKPPLAIPISATSRTNLDFGMAGYLPIGSISVGCTLAISSNSQQLVSPGEHWMIVARYK